MRPLFVYFTGFVTTSHMSSLTKETMNAEVCFDRPIISEKDISEIEYSLEQQYGFNEVIIHNWRRFEEPE